jgi:parvulin-like peptidyl-prolyl isomerase
MAVTTVYGETVMTQKRTQTTAPRSLPWKSLGAAMAFGGIVVAILFAARTWWGPQSATAQVRRPTATPTAGAAAAGVPAAVRSQVPQGAAQPKADPAAKTVAMVNGQPISREQLAQEAVRRYGKDVVENLVNKHLILQACQKAGVQITAQDLEQEITRMAANFGLSKDRWLDMLQQERHINPQQYRNDIIWPTLALRKLAADKLVIAPDELKEAWESEYGEKRQVRMIMISNKARCEQVQQYLTAKPDEFGKVAKDYSEDKPSASARGLIPPVRRHVGEPKIEEVVFALEEGKISPVVSVKVNEVEQHFIFRCEKKIEATTVPAAERAKFETALRNRLEEQKLRGVAAELFKKLQSEAKVVNVYNNPELKQQMPGVAATINGQQLTVRQLSEECITRHGLEVLEGEINRALLTQQLKKSSVTVEQNDINEEVARAAEMYGFLKPDGKPDVQAWLKKVMEEDGATVELYVQDAVWPSVALKKLVSTNVKVADEDLQKAYDANYGEQVEVLVCVLGNQRRAQEVWEMARANPTDAFFGDLAYQYSIEPTSKYNYGKVPPIRQHSGQPAIEEEAFSLEPGKLSGIVALGDKFVILKCVGRTKPKDAPEFAAVKDELFQDIHEKKLRIAMSQRFDEILASASIDNFLAGTSQQPQPATSSGVRPASALRTVPIPGIGTGTPSTGTPSAGTPSAVKPVTGVVPPSGTRTARQPGAAN